MVLLVIVLQQKNREMEAEVAANQKKDAGEYDIVVRQLQFELKAKVGHVVNWILYVYRVICKLSLLMPRISLYASHILRPASN